VYLQVCTHSYCIVISLKKELNGTVNAPSPAKIPKNIAACTGVERVFTPDGDGRLHPSSPTPWIKIISGSGSGTFFLKNEREEDEDDDAKTIFDGGRRLDVAVDRWKLFGATKPDTRPMF